MKITRIFPRVVRRDMDGRVWNPRTRWREKVMVLVFLETDTGHLGVGEAWNTAASPQALVATIEDDLARLVIGEDPFFVERVWQRAFRPTPVALGPAPRRYVRAPGGLRPPAGRPGLGLALTPDDV